MIYDILFVGATTLTCAWANKIKENNQNCIIVESGGTIGYDYSDSWYLSSLSSFDDKSPLVSELKKRNAINKDNIVHLPSISPILSGQIKKSDVECLFYTRIEDIKKTEYGYDVKIFAIGSEYVIKTRKIADTTGEFATHHFFGCDKPKYLERTLTFLIENTDEDVEFPYFKGCFDEGLYCKLSLIENENYSQAVHRLVTLRNSNPELFGYSKIVHFPMRIFEKTKEKIIRISKDVVWVPSQHYDNALKAYEEGLKMCDEAFLCDDTINVNTKIHQTINDTEYDIIVAGLGVAGSVAAIYTAMKGLKVLGIENMNFAGGMATGGGVYYYYQGEHKDGFYREIDKDGHRLCDDIFVYHPSNAGGPRKLVALEENFKKYGVNTIYNALVTKPLLANDKTVCGVEYTDCDGVHKVFAKQVIDATADGIICKKAGCQMTSGRWCDNNFTPFSTVMQQYIPDKDTLKVKYYDCGIVNQYDVFKFSKAIITANSDDEHLPDNFLNDQVIYMGTVPLTGLREGEHIVGEENVKILDVLNGKFIKDAAFYMVSIVDAHTKDFAFEEDIVRDWFAIAGLRRYNVKVPVSAKTLIPKGWEGLIVAGRHLGVDHSFSYALRMMDDMSRSGEIAALMAEYAIRTGDMAKNMPYNILKNELLKYGCLKEDDAPGVDKQSTLVPMKTNNKWVWLKDVNEIKSGLESDEPGYAIWSVRMLGEKIKEYLLKWIKSDNKNLRVNTALGMAMCGFYECEDVLLDELNDKSGYIPQTSNSFIVPRIISVIVACGMLKMEKSFEKIFKFFKDDSYIKQIPVRKDSFFFDDEDIIFQFKSFAFMAMVDILKESKILYEKYADVIREIIISDDFIMRVTSSGSKIKYNLLPTMKKIWNLNFPQKRI